MDLAVEAHVLESVAQSGLGRHPADLHSRRKEVVVLDLANMIEPDFADGDEPAKATQDILFSDQMVFRLSMSADGVNPADAKKLAYRREPGIANDWFVGQFEGKFAHPLHLAGEVETSILHEANIPNYLTFVNCRMQHHYNIN